EQPRIAREAAFLAFTEDDIRPRHDPRRGALKHFEPLHSGDDRGYHLDGTRAAADHRDGLALERITVVPTRSVEHFSADLPEPWNLRITRPAQPSARRDHHARAVALTTGSADLPATARLVETRIHDFAIETDVRAHPVFVRTVIHVREDLALPREQV